MHHLEHATPPPSLPGVPFSGLSVPVFPPTLAPSAPSSSSPEFQVVSRVEPSPPSPLNNITIAESEDAVHDDPTVDFGTGCEGDEALTPALGVPESTQHRTPSSEPLHAIAELDVPMPMDIESH